MTRYLRDQLRDSHGAYARTFVDAPPRRAVRRKFRTGQFSFASRRIGFCESRRLDS